MYSIMTTADEPLAIQTPIEENAVPIFRSREEADECFLARLLKINENIVRMKEVSKLKIAELEKMLGTALAKFDAKDAEIAELMDALAESKKKNAKDFVEIRSFIFRTKHVMDQMEDKRTAIYKIAAGLEADEAPKKIMFV